MCKVERTDSSSVEFPVLKSISQTIKQNRAMKRYPAIRWARMILSRLAALCVRRDASKINQTAAIPRSAKTIPKVELREAGSADKKVMSEKERERASPLHS